MPLDLFPYQVEGAAFLAPRYRAGLFDEMGTGKSAQTIRAMDDIGAMRIIVVCPAAVCENWRAELRKFSTVPRRIIKARNIHDVGAWLKGKADVLILSYEKAAKWSTHLQDDLIEVIVFDEAHYLKGRDSLRTRAMLGTHCDGATGLARMAGRAWFLTGSPVPNDPIDIWPFMRFTGATTLGVNQFVARYFKVRSTTFGQRQEPRNDMVPELRAAIAAYSMRRTSAQVGLQLPPIFTSTTVIDGDTHEIRELLREHPGLEEAVRQAVESGGLSLLAQMELPIATLRRLVGEAKAPAYADMLAGEFAGGRGKTVIMGIHVKALATIHAELQKAGVKGLLLDDASKAGEYVAAFQTDPTLMYFAVNIKRGGTGLTLVAAADIDMFESDWVPGSNAQALKRVHRIGQTQNVRARFIALANSIDEYVAATVERKTATLLKLDTAA
jgi:SWI/SNF-related matrix-associated actin-dependent regulator of chromatin subfamily A-like protein 1